MRIEGDVVWFSTSRGYGFIRDSAGSQIYLHKRDVLYGLDYVREGVRVEYLEKVVGTKKTRLQAKEVKPIIKGRYHNLSTRKTDLSSSPFGYKF